MPNDMRIDWAILEYLTLDENEERTLINHPLVTKNNVFAYSNYYNRERWYDRFIKDYGCHHVEFVTTNKSDWFFVVGYKK